MTEHGPLADDGHLPRILVVDKDDEFRRRVCRMIVANRVGRPVQASDGETAVAIAYEQQPAIVLLENGMPSFMRDAVAGALDLVSPDSLLIVVCDDEEEAPRYADGVVNKPALESLMRTIALVGGRGSHDEIVEAWLQCTREEIQRTAGAFISLHHPA